MTAALPSVSVIVVSWNRPADLRRCLMALQQQDHPALEVIVVADEPSLPEARGVLGAARFAENPGDNISGWRGGRVH